VGIELLDVRDRTWVSNYICIASKYGDSEVCDVENSRSATGEENGGIVVQEFQGEDVFRVVFSGYWLRAYPVHVMTLFIEGENSLTCSEGKEEGRGGWSCCRGVDADIRSSRKSWPKDNGWAV
jgi:hypothetical protein